MAEAGEVVARRMTNGLPNHVRHIKELQWVTDSGTLQWSIRADMVGRVGRSPAGTFFTRGGGTKASLYVVTSGNDSWVQTEPDETKLDNLLYLPIG